MQNIYTYRKSNGEETAEVQIDWTLDQKLDPHGSPRKNRMRQKIIRNV